MAAAGGANEGKGGATINCGACKKGCNTNVCACKKAGKRCSEECRCSECKNKGCDETKKRSRSASRSPSSRPAAAEEHSKRRKSVAEGDNPEEKGSQVKKAHAEAKKKGDKEVKNAGKKHNCNDALAEFEVPISATKWFCDGCKATSPAGSKLRSCRKCNFDLCEECFMVDQIEIGATTPEESIRMLLKMQTFMKERLLEMENLIELQNKKLAKFADRCLKVENTVQLVAMAKDSTGPGKKETGRATESKEDKEAKNASGREAKTAPVGSTEVIFMGIKKAHGRIQKKTW
jgi:hypothetical protein